MPVGFRKPVGVKKDIAPNVPGKKPKSPGKQTSGSGGSQKKSADKEESEIDSGDEADVSSSEGASPPAKSGPNPASPSFQQTDEAAEAPLSKSKQKSPAAPAADEAEGGTAPLPTRKPPSALKPRDKSKSKTAREVGPKAVPGQKPNDPARPAGRPSAGWSGLANFASTTGLSGGYRRERLKATDKVEHRYSHIPTMSTDIIGKHQKWSGALQSGSGGSGSDTTGGGGRGSPNTATSGSLGPKSGQQASPRMSSPKSKGRPPGPEAKKARRRRQAQVRANPKSKSGKKTVLAAKKKTVKKKP